MSDHYDVAIIGAGMSGLAAGIRLAYFGKRVCVLERHNAPGGLNSFYSFDGRKYDVGLHALTNYVGPSVKGTPLGRILRQLRIDRAELDLSEQVGSRVAFPGRNLRFTNDPAVLEAEVAREFPGQIDGFRSLLAAVRAYDDNRLDPPHESAREFVRAHVTDPVLEDMLFCPLMFYGSATEHDMELLQFVIMAKSIFLEGLARPQEGVRRIIRVLLDRLRKAGGERRMRCGVARIVAQAGRVERLLLDDGSEITADHVLSSVGWPETMLLCGRSPDPEIEVNTGRLGFVETISVHHEQPGSWGWGDDTIVFFNDSERFAYEASRERVDTRSGILCIPNNFRYGEGRELAEGLVRVTCLADPDYWFRAPESEYRSEKEAWFTRIEASARRFMPEPRSEPTLSRVATDMFTPRTVGKFTGHLRGAIYGAPKKYRTGRTHLENLYLCGTDQGYLGIVGALLSGITMANLQILQPAR
ncbi:NAD(P)/FAD-dependent oxidoreductase [Opitutales bacterium ASA1]|uniref:phytoene desaturase family protein n=1 Tax=Congregicoccus parvus TaxID=3081749 RepID=UPI002B292B9D|nr:NAD(P)/FAD-dependent oxidoreductase [Opitutales bacterium ASA1]